MLPLHANVRKRLGCACPLHRVGQRACLMNGGSRDPIGEGVCPSRLQRKPRPRTPVRSHAHGDRGEPRNTATEPPSCAAGARGSAGRVKGRSGGGRPQACGRKALSLGTLGGPRSRETESRPSPASDFANTPPGCSAPQGGPSRSAETEFKKKREPPPPPPRWLPTQRLVTPALRYKALIYKLKKEKR